MGKMKPMAAPGKHKNNPIQHRIMTYQYLGTLYFFPHKKVKNGCISLIQIRFFKKVFNG